MKEMYVVSFHSAHSPFGNGVRGIYSTRENAFVALGSLMEKARDVMYDYEENENLWLFFTERGTWKMEPMSVDEN